VHTAARQAAAMPLTELTPGSFPLPTAAAVLRRLAVRDRGADPKVPTTLSYPHRGALGYHADPTDVVALLCVRPANSGGLSSIVRSADVHDELARLRPDLVQVRDLIRLWLNA
jgi:hypothetical protein